MEARRSTDFKVPTAFENYLTIFCCDLKLHDVTLVSLSPRDSEGNGYGEWVIYRHLPLDCQHIPPATEEIKLVADDLGGVSQDEPLHGDGLWKRRASCHGLFPFHYIL